MPAVWQSKARVGRRLESRNINLIDPGLWCATLTLPFWDPTPSLTQPLTGMQLPGELVQRAESIEN